MAVNPHCSAIVLPSRRPLDLLSPARDADPKLHRSWSLMPRPHRPVCLGSLKTEHKLPDWCWPGTAASDAHAYRSPAFSRIVELSLPGSWDLVLVKFIQILLVFRLGFDKIMKTNLKKEKQNGL